MDMTTCLIGFMQSKFYVALIGDYHWILQLVVFSKKKSPISQTASTSKCNLPPDFWCSDPTIISECYTASGCSQYLNAIYGKPIHITVIYNPQLAVSRRYVLGYLKPHFVDRTNTQNEGKALLELEPAPIVAPNLSQCDGGCQEQALQECVASKFTDVKERTNQLICLMEARDANNKNVSATSIIDLWVQKCGNRNHATKETVLRCLDTQAWKQLTSQRAARQQALRPEPRRREPWILINGFSLESVQEHGHILHRMICLWYRGPNHNREHCARCEYEPTSC
uniref:Uncharacterized protein n=1 Tax=Ditylenchus dipsaci TaxID=166011 RepID=A0A915D5R9_9BILA